MCEQNRNLIKNNHPNIFEKYSYYKINNEEMNKKVLEETVLISDPEVLIQQTVNNYQNKLIN